MKKKITLIFLAMFIMLGLLVGCSNSNENISSNKKITVATSGTYYPFTYLDGDKVSGFEVDVWNEIGKRLGYDVEFKTAAFSGLFGMLESGKVDTIANQITITEERLNKYDISIPSVYSGAQIIVRRDNNSISSLNDLKGKKVGVDLGSNYEKIVRDKDINNEIEILTYQNTDAAFNELLLGRIDAVVIDKVSALVAIDEKNLNLKLAGEPIDEVQNGYPFNKEREDKDLFNKVNNTLNDMKEDGSLKDISEKWLKADVTSEGGDELIGLTDNNKSSTSEFDFMYSLELIPTLLKAIRVTITLSVFGMAIGLAIGVILSLIRLYNIPILKQIAEVYISFFRGTPLLVQLFILYFGIPQVIPALQNMSAYTAALLGLALNASAYIAEVLRASIDAIDKGQMEACLSMGMTRGQGLQRIILPQAFRIAIPSLGNIFVDTVKGSSLAFTLGVVELLAKAQMTAAASYKFFESYIVVAIMYWIVIGFFNCLQRVLERKLSVY